MTSPSPRRWTQDKIIRSPEAARFKQRRAPPVDPWSRGDSQRLEISAGEADFWFNQQKPWEKP